MKKVLIVFLILVMLVNCAGVAVFGADNKISSQLQEIIAQSNPQDKISIGITFSGKMPTAVDMPSWPDRALANKELREYYDNWYNTEIVPVVFDGIDFDEILVSSGTVIVEVKSEDIKTIADNDMVTHIQYFSNTNYEPGSELEFEDEFVEYLGIPSGVEYTYSGPLYSHYEDTSQTPSWFLVDGYGGRYLPADMLFGVFGDYYIYGCSSRPSYFNYHIYIADEQKFFPIEEAWSKDVCSKEEIFTQYLMPENYACLIGDANNDGQLSVLDATVIQQAEAKICFLDDWITALQVYGDEIEFYCDFNRDGKRSILDATAIQMKLAKVED